MSGYEDRRDWRAERRGGSDGCAGCLAGIGFLIVLAVIAWAAADALLPYLRPL